MALIKIYKFTVENRDWFEHYGARLEPEVCTFTSLSEAFSAWKKSRARDFCWEGDHERHTSRLEMHWEVDNVPVSHKHGYVLGHEPTEVTRRILQEKALERRCQQKADAAQTKEEKHFWEAWKLDVYKKDLAKKWPVYGFDGTIVDYFYCVPNMFVCAHYEHFYGYKFDGEGFRDDPAKQALVNTYIVYGIMTACHMRIPKEPFVF